MKYTVLVDLEAVPTLSFDDVRELDMHEWVMVKMRSSLNPDTWMDIIRART